MKKLLAIVIALLVCNISDAQIITTGSGYQGFGGTVKPHTAPSHKNGNFVGTDFNDFGKKSKKSSFNLKNDNSKNADMLKVEDNIYVKAGYQYSWTEGGFEFAAGFQHFYGKTSWFYSQELGTKKTLVTSEAKRSGIYYTPALWGYRFPRKSYLNFELNMGIWFSWEFNRSVEDNYKELDKKDIHTLDMGLTFGGNIWFKQICIGYSAFIGGNSYGKTFHFDETGITQMWRVGFAF